MDAAHSVGFLEILGRLVKRNSCQTEIISSATVYGVRPLVTPTQSLGFVSQKEIIIAEIQNWRSDL